MDRWADLMKHIVKNPAIADSIPNHANLSFGEGDVIIINGKPQRYSELVKPRRGAKRTSKKHERPAATV